jgi:diguanylate cyclase (GGDEF)-like protein
MFPSPEPIESNDDVQRRLAALASVAAAVSGAYELEEVVDLAAEQIRGALGVASVSISRWHLAEGVLQTLINVGDLGPGEERWPAYETYDIAMFPVAHSVLRQGEAHVTSLTMDNADPAEVELLLELGKESCAAVPILYDGTTWGEVYVTNATGTPDLTDEDVEFLQEICAQLSLAIGRAERYSALMEAAYRDALTGLANRRAFDERLERSLAAEITGGVGLLLGDVDGLKRINDGRGHGAGDDALRLVGEVLSEVCGTDALPARIGGDEFAVIIDGGTPEDDTALVARITRALEIANTPVSLSWGKARSTAPHGGAADLVRAADVAQYATKRRRAPRVSPPDGGRRAGRVPSQSDAELDAAVLTLLAAGLELLDGLAGEPPPVRRAALDQLIADATAAASSPGWTDRSAACLALLGREANRPQA